MSTAGQTMTEPKKSSDLGEISAVTVHLGLSQIAADRPLNAHFQSFAVTQKNQKCKTNMVLAKLQ